MALLSGAAFAVVLVAVLVLPSGAGRADAQEPGVTPALAATVLPFDLDPPEIRVDGFRLEPATTDTPSPTVVVSFAAPFALPRAPWRVIVSLGDPNGEHLRTTLVSVAGAEPSGRIERGDGVQWEDLGDAAVSTDTDAGQVRLAVPVDAADAQSVMWVEAEITQEGEIVGRRTPTVALVDLQGGRPGPALGTSPFAEVADGGEPGARALDAPGPVVQVVGRALELTTSAPAPASVDGAAVVDVVDSVILTQTTSGGPRTDRIEVDRRTGEVRLVAVGAEPFVAVPGSTPWLVNPPSTTAPGAPATVTFDLEALNEAIGGPAFDRAATQVAAERLLALDDGRILVAAGVDGTLAWFDDGLGASTAGAPPVEDATSGSTGLLVAIVAGLVAVVVLTVVVARSLVGLTRRRAEAAELRPAAERADVPAESPVPSAEHVDAPALGDQPTPTPTPTSADSASPTAPPLPASPAPGSGEPVEHDADPLAAFLADVDALSARVDRLGAADPLAGADESRTERGSVEQASR